MTATTTTARTTAAGPVNRQADTRAAQGPFLTRQSHDRARRHCWAGRRQIGHSGGVCLCFRLTRRGLCAERGPPQARRPPVIRLRDALRGIDGADRPGGRDGSPPWGGRKALFIGGARTLTAKRLFLNGRSAGERTGAFDGGGQCRQGV